MNWTVETIITAITVPLLLIGLGFAAWRFLGAARRDAWDAGELLAFGIASIVAMVVVVGLTWWGMYPWKAEYHQYRPVSGTVASIDARLAPTGDGNGGVEQKYVVTFTGNPQPYGVLDTRAAGVRAGDHLEIACVRRWQQAGTDGYDCMFATSTPGGAA